MRTCTTNMRSLLLYLFWTIYLSLAAHNASAQDLKNDIKGILEIYDTEFLSAYDLELKATMPTHLDRHRGVCMAKIHMVGDQTGKYLDLLKTSIEPVRYDGKDPYHGYDRNGNNIFSYDKYLAIHLGPADWRVVREPEQFVISSAGQLTDAPRTVPSRLEIFPVGHPNAANLYYRYLLGLGRGYSQLLDEVTSATLDERGLATVIAKGKLFSPQPGQWVLKVDTTNDYLVQEATFTTDGSAAPCFSSSSQKLYSAAIPLYAEGVVSITDYMIKVYLKNYTVPAPAGAATMATADETSRTLLMNTVASKTDDESQLPAKSLIVDFRTNDGDGMPLMKKKL